MSKEVKRYCLGEFAEPHTYPIGPGAHVLARDYETLEAERDALLAERDAYKKDAERYRWMRAVVIAEREGCTEELYDNECDRLLEAYDAALQGAQP